MSSVGISGAGSIWLCFLYFPLDVGVGRIAEMPADSHWLAAYVIKIEMVPPEPQEY